MADIVYDMGKSAEWVKCGASGPERQLQKAVVFSLFDTDRCPPIPIARFKAIFLICVRFSKEKNVDYLNPIER